MIVTSAPSDSSFLPRSRVPHRSSSTVVLTNSTYQSLKYLADLRGKSMAAVVFDLAHTELVKLAHQRRRSSLLPLPFSITDDSVGWSHLFRLGHPAFGDVRFTSSELLSVSMLLNPRIRPSLVREFVTRHGGLTISTRRGRQGVRLVVAGVKINMSRVEAEALTNALDVILARGHVR